MMKPSCFAFGESLFKIQKIYFLATIQLRTAFTKKNGMCTSLFRKFQNSRSLRVCNSVNRENLFANRENLLTILLPTLLLPYQKNYFKKNIAEHCPFFILSRWNWLNHHEKWRIQRFTGDDKVKSEFPEYFLVFCCRIYSNTYCK